MRNEERTPEGFPACVHCGYCCRKAVCLTYMIVVQSIAIPPCPMLFEQDGRFYCGLIKDAQGTEKEDFVNNSLAVGAGCSSNLANEDRLMRKLEPNHAASIMAGRPLVGDVLLVKTKRGEMY